MSYFLYFQIPHIHIILLIKIRDIQDGNKMEDKRIIIILVAIVTVLAAVLGGMLLQT